MSASPYAAEICAKTTADVKTWAYIGWVAATSTDPLAANHYGCACWTQLLILATRRDLENEREERPRAAEV
jgi:hypothetical protein